MTIRVCAVCEKNETERLVDDIPVCTDCFLAGRHKEMSFVDTEDASFPNAEEITQDKTPKPKKKRRRRTSAK